MSKKRLVLEALKKGPNYGLGLTQVTGISYNIYPMLRAMEKEGLLRSYETEPVPERGNRPRIYYELTELGKKAAE